MLKVFIHILTNLFLLNYIQKKTIIYIKQLYEKCIRNGYSMKEYIWDGLKLIRGLIDGDKIYIYYLGYKAEYEEIN